MRKNVLAAGVIAVFGGFCGGASAEVIPGTGPLSSTDLTTTNATSMILNPDGSGHQLVIPYYTAQGDQTSAIRITNTDPKRGKAVKVRFRGAGNSDDVLDFQLLLSPGDSWGAGLGVDGNGALMLNTLDNSCTVPRFSAVQGSSAGDKVDDQWGYMSADVFRLPLASNPGEKREDGTLEGYIEIINMADIVNPADVPGTTGTNVYKTIKHAPWPSVMAPACDPLVLGSAGLNGAGPVLTQADARSFDLDTPTTGLTGDWYILNLKDTTAFSGSAAAFEAWAPAAGTTPSGPGNANLVFFPQNSFSLSGSYTALDKNELTADPLLRQNTAAFPNIIGLTKGATGAVGGIFTGTPPSELISHQDLPDLSTPYVLAPGGAAAPETQAEMFSRVIEKGWISNQFVTRVLFDTSWVVSMPSRRYSMAYHYNKSGALYPPAGVFYTKDIKITSGTVPFFHDANSFVASVSEFPPGHQDRICVRFADRKTFNHEEYPGNLTTSSPKGPTGFCGEVTVVTFNGSKVLGSRLSTQNWNITPTFIEDGWTTVDFRVGGGAYPVLGYAAIRAHNSANGDNFGYTWSHKVGVAP